MIEVCAVVAGTILLAGIGIGFLMVIAVGIHREEAAFSLTSRTPDRLANGARTINGLAWRAPGVIQEVKLYRQGLLTVDGKE